MNKVIPVYPEHQEELRVEHLVDEDDCGYMSGYCSKCARHYRLCGEPRYMTYCVRQEGHEEHHLDNQGHSWVGEFR
jgi:hypothetical protein